MVSGWAQRPLAVCTIRKTYPNKAGTEKPAVGELEGYVKNSGALAEL